MGRLGRHVLGSMEGFLRRNQRLVFLIKQAQVLRAAGLLG